MSDTYFSNREHRNALRSEISEWNGTKFLYDTAGHAQKKVSADCVSFPLAVFQNLGLVDKDLRIPPYTSVRGGREEYFKLLAVLDNLPGLELIWERHGFFLNREILQLGDLIVCSSGSAIHHLLIYNTADMAWHCWPKIGVTQTSILTKHIYATSKRVYRFK